MAGEIFKVLLVTSSFIAVSHCFTTFDDQDDYDDTDFNPLYYPKPTPSDDDFYYYPDFKEYLLRSKSKYPKFHRIPITHFSCRDFAFPGYFADMLTGCQVFHLCALDGRRSSFLCPNQTIFNQQTLVCDWWYNVECKYSRDFYHLNDYKFSPRKSTGQQDDLQYIEQNSDYGLRTHNNNNGFRREPFTSRDSHNFDGHHNNHDLNRFGERPSNTDGHFAHISQAYDGPAGPPYRSHGQPPPRVFIKPQSEYRPLDYGARHFNPDGYHIQNQMDSIGPQGPNPYEALHYGASNQTSVVLQKESRVVKFNNFHLPNNNNSSQIKNKI